MINQGIFCPVLEEFTEPVNMTLTPTTESSSASSAAPTVTDSPSSGGMTTAGQDGAGGGPEELGVTVYAAMGAVIGVLAVALAVVSICCCFAR